MVPTEQTKNPAGPVPAPPRLSSTSPSRPITTPSEAISSARPLTSRAAKPRGQMTETCTPVATEAKSIASSTRTILTGCRPADGQPPPTACVVARASGLPAPRSSAPQANTVRTTKMLASARVAFLLRCEGVSSKAEPCRDGECAARPRGRAKRPAMGAAPLDVSRLPQSSKAPAWAATRSRQTLGEHYPAPVGRTTIDQRKALPFPLSFLPCTSPGCPAAVAHALPSRPDLSSFPSGYSAASVVIATYQPLISHLSAPRQFGKTLHSKGPVT